MKLKRFLSIIMALSMTTAVFTPVYASEKKEKLTLWELNIQVLIRQIIPQHL